ncbi:MAG TPA: polysaccharide biosynthesis/export family protein [Pyrinomonadaceae bacterium]|jgi:polysaccharide export outer membrane protein
MKKANKLTAPGIVLVLIAATVSIAAQTQPDPQKARPRTTTTGQQTQKPVNRDRLEPDDKQGTSSDVPEDMQANRQEQLSEEAAVNPYYNNFFNTYRLGPEDVISVDVFNQPRYSRTNITIPPSGRVSLPLIPGGVFVNGKTVEEVAELIKKKYDEFIIDPQVNVSLDKASSYRYSVIGDVGQPGIRLMNHRMTVTEALAEAGGVLATGDKSKVIILRRGPNSVPVPITVNVSAIYKGRAPDNAYLVPGDQILVPGNKLKKWQQIMSFANVLSFTRIFGLPY